MGLMIEGECTPEVKGKKKSYRVTLDKGNFSCEKYENEMCSLLKIRCSTKQYLPRLNRMDNKSTGQKVRARI